MGSQSKSKQKRRRHVKSGGSSLDPKAADPAQQGEQPPPLSLSSLPRCVQKLQSTEWAELEEACRDICYFSLQPKHHATFVQAKVPVRLAQLLFFTSPLQEGAATQPAECGDAPNASVWSIHRDVVYTQLAAAESLRNLITNSQEDEVLDLLTCNDSSDGSGNRMGVLGGAAALLPPITDFGKQFGDLLQNVYQCVKKAHQSITPQDWLPGNDEENENGDEGVELPANGEQGGFATPRPHNRQKRNNHSSNYLLLLALLEEILRLLTVCLEANSSNTGDSTMAKKGNECLGITGVFSNPGALNLLLEILNVSVNTTWENLSHPAGYFTEGSPAPQAAFRENGEALAPHVPASESGTSNPMLQALRFFKQEETKHLASIASATADVFCALSPDNPSVAAFFGPGGDRAAGAHLTPAQQAFLNAMLDAAELRRWWTEAVPDGGFPGLDGPADPALRAAALQGVRCHLTQATLALQATLLHTGADPDRARRVLPTVAAVLRRALAGRVWRDTLPLLCDTAAPREDLRAAWVALATSRIRCGLLAVRVFQTLTEAICGGNPPDLDDEVAFAQNPHAGILRESGGLHAFGLVLQDMLWLSARERPSGADSPDPDVMQRREQHLLREVAKENAEVTTMQFLILSMEVTVWNVASLLLLMVPVESLGDPSQVWSAILRAVEQRYVLLSAATASDDETALPPSSIAAESASARQLLWLQLESLVEMLWTLQRKRAKARGGVLHGSNQQLHARKSDVDLLIRLAWERREGGGVSKVGKKEAQPLVCMPTLTQACVGAIGLLCVSFGEVEATLVGASFALAILASYGNDSAATSHSSLLQLDGGMALSGTSHLANPAERRAWLQRLFAVDGIVSARVEAANALMDFFLDERYDIEVYMPQGVHQKLSVFLVQLREYIKQRLMISKFWKRNYQIVADPEDFEQWQEIEENLVGFLEYKAQHIRDLRKH